MTAGRATDASVFSRFGDAVRAALSERGFETPTEPQRRAIPPLADGRNALVVAPTGTGKTETAMLPVLDAIAERDDQFGMQALYVTPLRALNRDMRERLDWWGDELGLDVDVRHGDTTQYHRQKQAEDPPDVLVTTPETLQAMLTGSNLRTALEDVEHVVVDEVHELAAAKRGAQLTVGLERLRELSGPFQRIGLSATVGDPAEVGAFLTGGRDCAVVEVDAGSLVEFEVVRPDITDADERLASELMTDAEMAAHVRTIRDVVERHDSTLIFVNTRQTAEALGSRFKAVGADVGVHHGSLSRETRVDVEERFKDGDLAGLLCTSSMELGIDIGRVDHVVQYGSPREVARLLQRVGRAGHRSDRVSTGTVVTGSADDTFEAIAIARRAADGAVEPADIHAGSLDVVANQIVGLAMDFGDLSARRAYEVVTAAYPYSDLSQDAFRAVVREIAQNGLIWLDEDADRIEKSGGTWQYFYANLSMIPDEETYEVRDMAAGGQVGTLDERFVRNFAEPGASFVQRGEMWRIAEVDDEDTTVRVTPIEDPAGEVPSWTGREIPVPRPVAGEVGELRGVVGDQLAAGADPDAVARDLTGRYPADETTVRSAVEQVARHVGGDAPVPTDRKIVVEREARTVVVNAALGHQINETLGRLLAALLGQRTGSSVGMETDPYRIELDLPTGLGAREVREVLAETDPDHVEGLIELSLKNSDSLKFTLAHVAAKFGALKRYRGSTGPGMSGDRLLAALEDTPPYEEAVREVLHEELDVPGAAAVLYAIQSGDFDVVTHGGHTAIGTDGRSSGRELLAPADADASVVQAIEDRILDDDVRLVCLHCGDYDREKPVRRVADQPECPQCGSTRIAAISPWADDKVAAVTAPEKDAEQEKLAERTHRNASIVQSHGKKAVIALRGRGVGPQNAARIINKHREDEADFYRDILEREREYARTQAFWD